MLLPLGKSILPVGMGEVSKVAVAVDTKVDHNGIGFMVSEVTKPLENLDHHFPIRGLGFIKLAHSCILGILWDII